MSFSGTSAAAAHVAGVALLLLSHNPRLRESDVRRIIERSCYKGVGSSVSCTGSGGAYPTGFTGGETLVVSVDGNPDQTATFGVPDQSLGDVVNALNAQLNYCNVDEVAGELRITSDNEGPAASVEIVSAPVALGLTVGTCPVAAAYTFNATDVAHPNGTWNDEVGYGLIDAYAAVLLARHPRAEVTPGTIDFGDVYQGQSASGEI